MKTFLIVNFESDIVHAIIKAKNAKKALSFYLEHGEIGDEFIEHTHEWNLNNPVISVLADEKGEKIASAKDQTKFNEYVKRYFKNNEKFAEIFLTHWNMTPLKMEDDMKPFPSEMIRYIFIKEQKKQNWEKLNVVNLDEIPFYKAE